MAKLKRSISELSDRIKKASSPRKRSSTVSLSSTSLPKSSIVTNEFPEVDSVKVEEQWFERFRPKSIGELALHKRKLDDVQRMMEDMISGRSEKRILLLSGPAGCSKSTCVKLLSDVLVPKYRNGTNLTMTGKVSPTWIEYLTDTDSTSPVESFGEFLSQSKYLTNSNVTVLLVEDLPNIFHENTLLRFRESLLQWLFYEGPLPPLIISLTECHLPEGEDGITNFSLDRNFIAETIFGREILNHPRFSRVKFNPINNTLMKRALGSIICRVKNEIPSEKHHASTEFIRQLAAKSGDIRSAINTMQFWCTSNINDFGTFSTRESSTELFHAIGRVIYGSKDLQDNLELVNTLVDDTNMAPNTIKLGTLENYTKYNKGDFSFCTSEAISGSLSESDLINIGLPESLYYCLAKVRYELGLISKSSNKIHGQPNFPREFKVQNERRKFNMHVEHFINVEFYKYNNVWTKTNTTLYGGFFGPHIRKKLNFKAKSLSHYINSLPNESNYLRSASKQAKEGILLIDDFDIFDRIGGELNTVAATTDLEAPVDNLNANDRLAKNMLQKLEKLKAQWEKRHQFSLQQENESEGLKQICHSEFEGDPIADSDFGSNNGETDQFIDEEGDSELYEILSQKPAKSLQVSENIDLSDSDLENL